jgi:two-component system phosphate regulon sensor histidine kinase PhoR
MKTSKQIDFRCPDEAITGTLDPFHFENAVNNMVDNAIKYGGDQIEIELKSNAQSIELAVSDNGNTLTAKDKDSIFEKFHRVSKGNIHDVKGYGIGLYHAKKIIEKHGGQLTLDLAQNKTTFKISIPNA